MKAVGTVTAWQRGACRLRRAALAVALAATAAGQAATPGVDAPPPPAPPRALQLPPLHELVLDNGLRAVVAPRPGLPLASVAIVLRGGAEADPPGRAGLADATATLLARGALRGGRPVDASALARQAEALGASLESDSDWRSVRVAMTVSTPRLGDALALLADVVRRPLLGADELERWRAQALDDVDLARADPAVVAAQVARRLRWGAGAHGAVVTRASVQRISRDDVRALHRRIARPDAALVVFAGDVDAPHALALLRRHLGDWRRPAGAPAPDTPRDAAPLPAALALVDMPGAGQSSVVLAAPWSGSADPELPAAQVAAALLAGGYSSRLSQAVRIRRGLSYGVYGSTEAYGADGWWSAAAQTHHASAAQVLQLMRDEVERLRHEPPDAGELAARQAALVGAFARGWDTTAGIATLLASQWASGRPWSALAEHAQRLAAVDAAQVSEFARRRWPPDALRAVVVGDLAAAGDAAPTAAGPVLRLPLSRIDFDRTGLTAEAP